MGFQSKKSQKQPDFRQLIQYATWLLARRDYSRAELLTKFKARYLEDAELFEQVLNRLVELGLQSDQRFTENFINSKTSWGSQRLRMELFRKGIAKDLVEEVIVANLDEIARCAEVLAKKLRGDPVSEDYKEKQKLLAFLVRRGFSLDTVKSALEQS